MMAQPNYFGEAAPPEERTCDWCGRPGVVALELFKPGKKVGTGQFLYPCARHVRLARETVETLRTRKKAA